MTDTPYEFAKLFTLDGYQIVVTRERTEGGDTADGPALIIHTSNGQLNAEGCLVLPDTEEGEVARDRMFNDLTDTLEGTSPGECARAIIQHLEDVTHRHTQQKES